MITTKYGILLQNIVVYHEKIIFYYKMWYFTTECGNSIGYTITNSSIIRLSSFSIVHTRAQRLKLHTQTLIAALYIVQFRCTVQLL